MTSQTEPSLTAEEILLGEIRDELTRAREKFPGDRVTFTALVEEVGELAKAFLDEPQGS